MALPPTFLKTTLFTNELRGNVTVKGGVIIQSNGNAYVLGNTSIITGIGESALPTNVLGNLTGVYANVTAVNATTLNASGNATAEYFLGNGALLSGIEQYVLPSEITADVLGNVTATGNVEAAFFLGNGAMLSGIEQYVLPSEINADVLGNVTATGNVSAEYFLGNGALLSGIEQYVLPSQITADVLGNVTATGNVSANYFLGNGYNLILDGYTLKPMGNVANIEVRLALPSPPIGTVVKQADNDQEYLLLATPSNVDANWLEFTGANYPVTSVFGRTGDISLLSGVDVNTIGGTSIVGNGDIQSLTVDILGNVTATGNVSASYFLGNGAMLTGIAEALPAEITADILGNVTATGNVTADYFLGNGAMLTGIAEALPTEITADILGNVTATGNVTADYFLGNGAMLTGIAEALPAEITADILGNVTATGNVTADYFLGNGNFMTGVAALDSSGLIPQHNLNGYLTVPQGYVANAAVRLSLGSNALPIGSLVRQTDNGNSYLLTETPSNVEANWLEFTGLNFPVNTVFGRVGDILSSYGDYTDGLIELEANIGPILAGNSVSAALTYLNDSIVSGLPASGNIDIHGNVTATGNVSANYFIGNGSQLTGVIPPKISAPGFKAYQTTTQACANSAATLYSYETLDNTFNNTHYNNTGANVVVGGRTIPAYAFSPNVAGYYMVSATTRMAMYGGGESVAILFKNGSPEANGSDVHLSDGSNFSSTVSTLFYLNGSTDYVQMYVFNQSNDSTTFNTQPNGGSFSWFTGILLNSGMTYYAS